MMRKGITQGWILVLILGGIILAQQGFPFITGWTTLSLTQADFQSSSDFFTGKTWILYVSQGGMGQYAEGTLTKSEIGSKSGTQPQNDLKLSIDFSEQSCEYPLRVDYNLQKIKKYEIMEWGCTLFNSDKATENCGEWDYAGKYSLSFTCFCLKPSSAYTISRLENPNVHTTSVISAETRGLKEQKTFDTRREIRGYLGNNVYVKWDGYKIGTTPCSDQSPYLGTYFNGQWKLISQANYNIYTDQLNSLKTLIGSGIKKDFLETQVNILNVDANQALQQSGFGSISNPTRMDNAIVVRDVSGGFVAIPTWVFYVNAEWIGIVQPVGRPSITGVRTDAFRTGEEGIVEVTVKNIGTQAENFDVSVECPLPFNSSGVITNNVYPNSDYTFRVPIYAQASERTSRTCTAYARGVEFTDSRTFTATVDPQIVCQPNTWVCEENTAKQCNSAGSGLVVMERCEVDEECAHREDGRTFCKERDLNCAQDGEKPTILKPCCEELKEINGVCSTRGIGYQIWDFVVKMFKVGIIVGIILGIITYLLPVLTPLLPPLILLNPLKNRRNFIIIVVVVSAILTWLGIKLF